MKWVLSLVLALLVTSGVPAQAAPRSQSPEYVFNGTFELWDNLPAPNGWNVSQGSIDRAEANDYYAYRSFGPSDTTESIISQDVELPNAGTYQMSVDWLYNKEGNNGVCFAFVSLESLVQNNGSYEIASFGIPMGQWTRTTESIVTEYPQDTFRVSITFRGYNSDSCFVGVDGISITADTPAPTQTATATSTPQATPTATSTATSAPTATNAPTGTPTLTAAPTASQPTPTPIPAINFALTGIITSTGQLAQTQAAAWNLDSNYAPLFWGVVMVILVFGVLAFVRAIAGWAKANYFE